MCFKIYILNDVNNTVTGFVQFLVPAACNSIAAAL